MQDIVVDPSKRATRLHPRSPADNATELVDRVRRVISSRPVVRRPVPRDVKRSKSIFDYAPSRRIQGRWQPKDR